MLASPFSRAGVLPLARRFSLLHPLREKLYPNPSPKDFETKDPKVLAARDAAKRKKQRAAPQSHPLYMDVPLAMKYMRAAEVGRTASMTTVSLHISVVRDKKSPMLLGSLVYPKAVKSNSPLIFTEDPEHIAQLQELAKTDRRIRFGGSQLVDEIANGMSVANFTQAYATPEMHAKLPAVARILGPRGLMPAPKKGTVSADVVALYKENALSLSFKQKKGDILTFPVGRCDFSDEEIIKNIQAASKAVHGLQPPGTKNPALIGTCFLSSTHGPAAVIDFRG